MRGATMKRPPHSMREHGAVAELLRAMAKLQPAQGALARARARSRVLTRLATVRKYMDRDYPRPPVKRRRRKRADAGAPRTTEVVWDVGPAKLYRAGIKVIPCFSGSGGAHRTVLIPIWARDVLKLDPTVAQLREAKRNLSARRSLLAAARLKGLP
jgi:hypothetical protein